MNEVFYISFLKEIRDILEVYNSNSFIQKTLVN